MRLHYVWDDIRTFVGSKLSPERPPLPPRRLIDMVGGGDFVRIGGAYLEYLIELAGLQKTDCVLDIGCGCGRMAVPLTGYLTAPGEYQGFDIVPKAIRWCVTRVAQKHRNFHFQVLDVKNDYYNPRGKLLPENAVFPFPDGYFDVAFATSVFTHLLPPAQAAYISETARTLRPGGRLLATFFLLNEETERRIALSPPRLTFRHARPGCRTEDEARPELAVAVDQDAVLTRLAAHSLAPLGQIRFGKWRDSGASTLGADYQDILVLEKKPAGSGR